MRILLILIISLGASAADLIVDAKKVSELSKRLGESYYQNYRRVTPYFYENNLPKVVVERFNKCLKLHFYQNSINYSKTSCLNKREFTLADFPGFKSIDLKTQLKDQKVLLKEEILEKKYSGVGFKFFLRDLHSAKTADYKFEMVAQSFLEVKKGKVTLLQTLTFSRDAFHFLPEDQKVTTQIIDLKAGDFLFQKGETKFILYKRYQPKPLDFKFLWLNPAYKEYLSTIDSQLFTDGDKAYCFMDYHIDPSPYDCQNLAIGAVGSRLFPTYKRFDLIKIDLNGSIELL